MDDPLGALQILAQLHDHGARFLSAFMMPGEGIVTDMAAQIDHVAIDDPGGGIDDGDLLSIIVELIIDHPERRVSLGGKLTQDDKQHARGNADLRTHFGVVEWSRSVIWFCWMTSVRALKSGLDQNDLRRCRRSEDGPGDAFHSGAMMRVSCHGLRNPGTDRAGGEASRSGAAGKFGD